MHYLLDDKIYAFKYGAYTVGALVDMTHKSNSPWDCADKSEMYSTISDDLIRSHHCFEVS